MPFHDYSTAIPRPTFFCDFFNHPNSFVGFHHDGFTGHMFPNLGPPQKQLIMPGGGPVVKPHFGPLLLCLSSSALQSRRPFFSAKDHFSYFFHPDPGVSMGIPIPMDPTSPVRPDDPRLGHEGKGSAERLDEPTVST